MTKKNMRKVLADKGITASEVCKEFNYTLQGLMVACGTEKKPKPARQIVKLALAAVLMKKAGLDIWKLAGLDPETL